MIVLVKQRNLEKEKGSLIGKREGEKDRKTSLIGLILYRKTDTAYKNEGYYL